MTSTAFAEAVVGSSACTVVAAAALAAAVAVAGGGGRGVAVVDSRPRQGKGIDEASERIVVNNEQRHLRS